MATADRLVFDLRLYIHDDVGKLLHVVTLMRIRSLFRSHRLVEKAL